MQPDICRLSCFAGRRFMARVLPVVGCAAIMVVSAWPLHAADKDDGPTRKGQKIVIPFDFESKFDDGRYGAMVADGIWKKLSREKGTFVVPESMLDVRDTCKSNRRTPKPDMPLDKVEAIVVDDFGAQIGIWGSVERAPGAEGEIYDLAIQCVDFSAGDNPRTIYTVKARTKSVSEIPHLYVQQMLDALFQRAPAEAKPDASAEAKWANGPNLVGGGDFESAAGGVPKGWEAVAGQKREPLGGLVTWTAEAGSPSNHVIRFTLDRMVAENEGVMYYCKRFPVEANAKYRFQIRYRTSGPSPKIFIKCYDEIGTEYRAGEAQGHARTKRDDIPEEGQLREVYRSQQNLKGGVNVWNVQTEDFTPKHTKYTPRWCSVMLYAYLKPGTVEWDDVVVKQIAVPPAGEETHEKRPSLGTKVTVKEMEENQRRSKESRAKPKSERGESRKPQSQEIH